MPMGPGPTLIGVSLVFVAVRIGVTVPADWLATSIVWPSGLITMEPAPFGTLIGLPAEPLGTWTGITVLSMSSRTKRVFPFGSATTSLSGPPPLSTTIFFPGLLVARLNGVIDWLRPSLST